MDKKLYNSSSLSTGNIPLNITLAINRRRKQQDGTSQDQAAYLTALILVKQLRN